MLKSTGAVVTEEQALMPQNCQDEDVKRLRENINATLQSDISEEEKRDFLGSGSSQKRKKEIPLVK
jgi:hypothetical protein